MALRPIGHSVAFGEECSPPSGSSLPPKAAGVIA